MEGGGGGVEDKVTDDVTEADDTLDTGTDEDIHLRYKQEFS